MNKISILLAAYKSRDLLDWVFLKGLSRNTTYDTELVIYDNGGNGDLDGKVVKNQKISIVKIGDGQNIGLNAALNECAKVATGSYFYLPHTDMYLLPRWDTCLLESCKNQPPASYLLCSRSIEPTKGHTNFHIISDFGKRWYEFEEKKLVDAFSGYRSNSIVTGYRMPFFMHKSLWEKMGGVDSNYFSYCTDDDLVQEAYDVGVRKFWMVYGSLVYHLQGNSNQQQTVDRDSEEPYRYFVDKWKKRGYSDAEHPGQWHPKLIPNYLKIK